jgi:hypothetical protein
LRVGLRRRTCVQRVTARIHALRPRGVDAEVLVVDQIRSRRICRPLGHLSRINRCRFRRSCGTGVDVPVFAQIRSRRRRKAITTGARRLHAAAGVRQTRSRRFSGHPEPGPDRGWPGGSEGA